MKKLYSCVCFVTIVSSASFCAAAVDCSAAAKEAALRQYRIDHKSEKEAATGPVTSTAIADTSLTAYYVGLGQKMGNSTGCGLGFGYVVLTDETCAVQGTPVQN